MGFASASSSINKNRSDPANGVTALIDTIKIAYPMSQTLYRILEERSERLQKISPDGDIVWEKSFVSGSCMPSHYSGLRITTVTRRDLIEMGFNSDFIDTENDLAFFEFSLQKWQSPSAYNNYNSTIENDLLALRSWITELSSVLEYVFSPDLFRLYRVDLSRNLFLLNCHPPLFIRSIELNFSKHAESDSRLSRHSTSVSLRSNWIGKKIYYKFQEFMDVERKKHFSVYTPAYLAGETDCERPDDCGFEPLTLEEIKELSSMVRFEMEFKRAYLKRYNMCKIIDITRLVDRFETELDKVFNVPLITNEQLSTMTLQERSLVSLIQDFGYSSGKSAFLNQYSPRYFYKLKKSLLGRGIDLDNLDNIKNRASVKDLVTQSQDANSFSFSPARFYEPYLLAA